MHTTKHILRHPEARDREITSIFKSTINSFGKEMTHAPIRTFLYYLFSRELVQHKGENL